MDEGWIRQVEHAIDTFEEDDRLIELKVSEAGEPSAEPTSLEQ